MASFDRYRYEQQAAAYLSKGQTDKALQTYAAILRQMPRDLRIRQKMAELYARTGRNREAEKHFREVVRLYNEEGNYRASLSVLKQLRQMKPDDAEILAELADATNAAGFPNEAEPLYEQAIKQLSRPKPETAAEYIEKLLRLRPGDTPLRLERADLLRRAKQFNRAYGAYMEIIQEMRRWGRITEIGRIAAMALEVKPGDGELLQDAAAAAMAEGDTATAFKHLQTAYSRNPRNPRTLDLLAKAFEGGENAQQARPILITLARLLAERADHAGRLRALERAAALGSDAELEGQLERARTAAEAASFRLTSLSSAAPADEAQLRACTRIEVFLRYKLSERAVAEAAAAREAAPGARAVLAAAAEVAAAEGEIEAALEIARGLLEGTPKDERGKVQLRIAVLEGKDPADWIADDLDDLEDDDLLDDDELEASMGSDPFAGLGGRADPFSRGRSSAQGSGLFDDILSRGGVVAEVDPEDMGRPAMGSPEPRHPAPRAAPEPLAVQAGLIDMGLFEQAKAALEGERGLAAEALRCRCRAAAGDTRDAMDDLRDEMDDAGESDPGYPTALFSLAMIAAASGKHRRARRWLDDLAAIAPGFRAEEVRRCQTALDSL